MIHSCTVWKHQLLGYTQPGLLSQIAFCQPCKAALVHYRACGPLGSNNQSWCGVKLLTMSISTHPVGHAHICHLLRAQHHCRWPNGREGPPSACPPLFFFQGNIVEFVKLTGWTGSHVLYMGDHVYSDLAVSYIHYKIL